MAQADTLHDGCLAGSFRLHNPCSREDLNDFVACCRPDHRNDRTATWYEANPDDRWRPFPYDELATQDKVTLDIFWLRDKSLGDSANLPAPDILASEIVKDLKAVLAQFESIEDELSEEE